MRFLLRSAFLGLVLVSAAGCAVVWLGAGAVGGYAVSRDSIKNDLERSPGEVYAVSHQVVRALGILLEEDEPHGFMKANVEGARVTITIKSLSPHVVELKVKARRGAILPKLDVAERVYNKIMEELL